MKISNLQLWLLPKFTVHWHPGLQPQWGPELCPVVEAPALLYLAGADAFVDILRTGGAVEWRHQMLLPPTALLLRIAHSDAVFESHFIAGKGVEWKSTGERVNWGGCKATAERGPRLKSAALLCSPFEQVTVLIGGFCLIKAGSLALKSYPVQIVLNLQL